MDEMDFLLFELDFCTALNMMAGKPYGEAVEEAKVWVKDAHSKDSDVNPDATTT